MKSAILFAQYNLFGVNVYMCYDYVHLDNLSDISAYRHHNVQLQSRGILPCNVTHIQALLQISVFINVIKLVYVVRLTLGYFWCEK